MNRSRNGGRNFLHGNLYQWKLLTIVAIRAFEETEEFELISEDGDYHIFDDIVLRIGNNLICLQVKHSSKNIGDDDFTRGDLLNRTGRLNLLNSFNSWIHIERNNQNRDILFGFVSNRDIKEKYKFLEEINRRQLDRFLNNTSKTYRFRRDEEVRRPFVNAIFSGLQQPHNLNVINRFLDLLVFKINQPNLGLIDEGLLETTRQLMTRRNLKNIPEFNLICSFVLMKFELDILNWFANINTTPLQRNEIRGFIDSAINVATPIRVLRQRYDELLGENEYLRNQLTDHDELLRINERLRNQLTDHDELLRMNEPNRSLERSSYEFFLIICLLLIAYFKQ
jgi:hypothetical protein